MNTGKKAIISVLAIVVAIVGAGGIYVAFIRGDVKLDTGFYDVPDEVKVRKFSQAGYAKTLDKYVDDEGMVYYAKMKEKGIDLNPYADGEKSDNDEEESPRLNDYLWALASLEPEVYEKWSDRRKIAFLLNAYNAITLKAILDNYPINPTIPNPLYPQNSIRQIPKVWKKKYLVMGREMSLEHIEHGILRKEFDEPRIHVALVCAAMSCPPLRREPYIGKKLDAQLDDQSGGFLASGDNFRIDRDNSVVHLSSIFKWFGGDFTGKYAPETGYGDHDKDTRAVLNFISNYVDDKDAEYLRGGDFEIKYIDYDWSLNERRTAE